MKKENTEDKEFDLLLLEKRHREILASLKVLSENLSKDTSEDTLKILLKQESQLKLLQEALSNLTIPKPEVIVSTEEFEKTLESIKNDILESNRKVIASIENRLLPYSFDLKRDTKGGTTSVNVNYKSAKEIR